jgi:hypothetical protein
VNRAGSTVAASAPYHAGVARHGADPPHDPGRSAHLSLKLAATRIRAGAPLAVSVANDGQLEVSGSLSGRAAVVVGSAKRSVKLKAKPFRLAVSRSAIVKLALPGPLREQLLRRHKLSITLSATFAPSGGGESNAVGLRVVPRLKT